MNKSLISVLFSRSTGRRSFGTAAATLLLTLGLATSAVAEDVGPFQWTRWLLDPANPQASALALDPAVTENASVVAGATATQGAIDLRQWSGSNQAGTRSWAGNSLVAPVGTRWWIGSSTWDIQRGSASGGPWTYSRRTQQDLKCTLGYAAIAASALSTTHGNAPRLDTAQSYARVVVSLPQRWVAPGTSAAWQHGYYSGNPTQSGIWQIPAGQSLGQAQQASANRLASLTSVLTQSPRSGTWQMDFQVGSGGSWTLAIDLDGDAVADTTLTSADAGNSASAFPAITGQSGLLVSVEAAGGNGIPYVGVSPYVLTYRQIGTIPPPVNQAPVVTLTAPTTAQTLVQPASLTLSATASDSDGSVSQVTFLASQGIPPTLTTTTIGTDTDGSDGWSVPWTAIPVGNYQVSATAQDNLGLEATSTSVAVTVLAPVSVAWTSATSSVTEASGTTALTATLSAASPYDVSVSYSALPGGSSGGTATATGAGADIAALAGTLTFPAGTVTQFIEVTVLEDTLFEGDETLRIALQSPSVGLVLGTSAIHTRTITDNDVQPTVAFTTAATSVAEVAGTVDLTVQLDGVSGLAVQVPYAVVGGSATAGSDFQFSPGTLTIPAGSTTAAMTLTILADSEAESDETIIIALNPPTAANLGVPSTHTVTILGSNQAPVITAGPTAMQDPSDPTRLLLSVTTTDDAALNQLCIHWTVTGPLESGNSRQIILYPNGTCHSANSNATVSARGTYTVSVDITDAAGSSVSGSTTGMISGVATTVAVTPMTVDVTPGSTRQFAAAVADQFGAALANPSPAVIWTVSPSSLGSLSADPAAGSAVLSVASNATPADNGTVTATATDPGSSPSATGSASVQVTAVVVGQSTVAWASADGGSVTEGLNVISLPLVLSAAATTDVTVYFQVGGTATRGPDHDLVAYPVIIPAGATTASIPVVIHDDNAIEGDETVIVTLIGATGADLGSPLTRTLTIIDNDLPRVGFTQTQVSIVAGDSVGTTLRLQLSAPAPWAVTVPYTISGSAVAGTDFNLPVTGVLTIPAGQTSAASATLPVTALAAATDGATIIVTLVESAPANPEPGVSGAALSASSVATVTIISEAAAAADTTKPTVRLDPPPATFLDSTTVTLSGTPEAAAIWYTIDGSTPMPEQGTTQPYTDPLILTATTTIRAVATLPDGQGGQRTGEITTGLYVRVSSDGFAPATNTPADGHYTISPACLEFQIPPGSATFPVRVEVLRGDTVIAQPRVHRLDAKHAYADIPLDALQPVTARWYLRDETGVETQSEKVLTWAVTDLASNNAPSETVLRLGDSLLMTATGAGEQLMIDRGDESRVVGQPGQPLVLHYETEGYFQASAWIDGSEAGRHDVVAMTVSIPSAMPIMGEVDFNRPVTALAGPDASQVVFTSSDTAVLTITGSGTSGSGTTSLTVTAVKPERGAIIARLKGESGAIVLAKSYYGFAIEGDPVIQLAYEYPGLVSTGPMTSAIRPAWPREWMKSSTAITRATRIETDEDVYRMALPAQNVQNNATEVTVPRPVIHQRQLDGSLLQVSRAETSMIVQRYRIHVEAIAPDRGRFLTIGADSDGDGVKDYGPVTWTSSVWMTPASVEGLKRIRVFLADGSLDTILPPSGTLSWQTSYAFPWTDGALLGLYTGRDGYHFPGNSLTSYIDEVNIGGMSYFSGNLHPKLRNVSILPIYADQRQVELGSVRPRVGRAKWRSTIDSAVTAWQRSYLPELNALPTEEARAIAGPIAPMPAWILEAPDFTVRDSAVSLHGNDLEVDRVGVFTELNILNTFDVLKDIGVSVSYQQPGTYHTTHYHVGPSRKALVPAPYGLGAVTVFAGRQFGSVAYEYTFYDGYLGTYSFSRYGQSYEHNAFGTIFSGATSGANSSSSPVSGTVHLSAVRDNPRISQVGFVDGSLSVTSVEVPISASYGSGEGYNPESFRRSYDLLQAAPVYQRDDRVVVTGTNHSASPEIVGKRTFERVTVGAGRPPSEASAVSVLSGRGVLNPCSGNANFIFPIIHFETPDAGPNLMLSYNTTEGTDHGFGPGWHTNYDMRVVRPGTGITLGSEFTGGAFIDETGWRTPLTGGPLDTVWSFVTNTDGLASNGFRSGEYSRLVRNDNWLLYFDVDGWLSRQTSIRGETLVVERDPITKRVWKVIDEWHPERTVDLSTDTKLADLGIVIAKKTIEGKSIPVGIQRLGSATSGQGGESGDWTFTYDAEIEEPAVATWTMSTATLAGTDHHGHFKFADNQDQVVITLGYLAGKRATGVVQTVTVGPSVNTGVVTTLSWPNANVNALPVTIADDSGASWQVQAGSASMWSRQTDAAGLIHHQQLEFWFASNDPDSERGVSRRVTRWTGPATGGVRYGETIHRYDVRGDLIESEAIIDPAHSSRTAYVWSDLRKQNPALIGAHVLVEQRARGVQLRSEGPKDDLVSSTMFAASGRRAGLPVLRIDACGALTSWTYSDAGHLVRSVDARGKAMTFRKQDGYGQPGEILSPAGVKTTIIGRNASGDSSGIIDRYGFETSVADRNALRIPLTKNLPKRGSAATRTTTSHYDPLGNVVAFTDELQRTVTITYDRRFREVSRVIGAGLADANLPAGVDTTPPPPVTTTSVAGAQGRWTVTTSVAGKVQQIQVVDAIGRVLSSTSKVVLLPLTDPTPTDSTTTMTYDPVSGFLTAVSDPRNAAWTTEMTYDRLGRMLSTTTPAGIETSVELNTVGWILSQTLENHYQTTNFVYDACGRTIRTVNPAGGVIEASYDQSGNLIGTTSGAGRSATTGYDADGNAVSSLSPFGETVTQDWDGTNAILRQVITRKPGQILTTTTTLNDLAQGDTLRSSTGESAEGDVTASLTLRADNTVSASVSTLGAMSTNQNDEFGRTAAAQTQQTFGGTLVNIGTKITDRDAFSQPTATVSTLGLKQETVTNPETGSVQSSGDNALATAGNPNAVDTRWEIVERDHGGRTLRQRRPTGADAFLEEVSTYDADGRLLTHTSPGQGTRKMVYDGVRVTHIFVNDVQRQTTTDFSELNQPLRTVVAGDPETVTTFAYDSYGRMWQRKQGNSEWITFFDAITGAVTGSRTPEGLTRTARDTAGRVTCVSDTENRRTCMEYDARNRVTAKIHPGGKRETFQYKKDTSLVTVHFDGDETSTFRRYAADGFCFEEKVTRGTTAPVLTSFDRSMAEDGSGTVSGVTLLASQAGATQSTTTDRLGRTVSMSLPGQAAIATQYDLVDRQTAHGDKAYAYTASGLLESITQTGTGSVGFQYTSEGWVQTVTLPHGVTRTYAHDTAGRITALDQVVGLDTESSTLARDGRGRVITVSAPDSVRSFTYADDRLVRERRTGTASALTLYRYDASGNRTAQSTFAEPQARSFAAAAAAAGDPLPASVAVSSGTWSILAANQLAVTTTGSSPAIALASLTQVNTAEGETAVAEQSLTLALAPASSGTVAAGYGIDGTQYRYHLLWQRRALAGAFAGDQEGRLVIQRVDRNTDATTDLAVSEWAADSAPTRALRLTWWPDGTLQIATGPATPDAEWRIDVRLGANELSALPTSAPIALVATTADGAASASAAFSALKWSVTTASRAAWQASFNADNQLVTRSETGSAGNASEIYIYSTAGELTDLVRTGFNSKTIHYGYDAFHRRSSQTIAGTGNGTGTYNYAYHLNTWRRASLTHPNGNITAFQWDGQDLIRETTTASVANGGGISSQGYFNHSGQPLWQYGMNAGTQAPIPGSVAVYGRDLLGDITGHIVPATQPDELNPGMAVYGRRFQFDAFGVRREQFRQVEPGGVASYITPTVASFGPGYKGQYQDPAGDLYLRHRYYLPQLGSFGSVDPAKAGGNWYAYAGGDPVNYWDPTGLWRIRGRFAVAEQGDTLSSLAAIVYSDGNKWSQLGYTGNPRRLRPGEEIDIGWFIEESKGLVEYASTKQQTYRQVMLGLIQDYNFLTHDLDNPAPEIGNALKSFIGGYNATTGDEASALLLSRLIDRAGENRVQSDYWSKFSTIINWVGLGVNIALLDDEHVFLGTPNQGYANLDAKYGNRAGHKLHQALRGAGFLLNLHGINQASKDLREQWGEGRISEATVSAASILVGTSGSVELGLLVAGSKGSLAVNLGKVNPVTGLALVIGTAIGQGIVDTDSVLRRNAERIRTVDGIFNVIDALGAPSSFAHLREAIEQATDRIRRVGRFSNGKEAVAGWLTGQAEVME